MQDKGPFIKIYLSPEPAVPVSVFSGKPVKNNKFYFAGFFKIRVNIWTILANYCQLIRLSLLC